MNEMKLPRLVAFDIDGTIARSKSAIEPAMADLLSRLLEKTDVAIISGGTKEQFLEQVVNRLPPGSALSRLHLLPTSGAALYELEGDSWQPVYEERIPETEAVLITSAIENGAKATGLIDFSAPSYGPRIEYRGTQVTLSALGQQAPLEEKEAWDPSGQKRDALRESIAPLLPDYDVKRGGKTSIDVTRHGINKAYGMRKLSEHLSIPISHMLYVGDALFPGGNDEVVKETGVETRAVEDPRETMTVIRELLGEPIILAL